VKQAEKGTKALFGEKQDSKVDDYVKGIQEYTQNVTKASVETSKLNRETQNHITAMYTAESAPIEYGEAISTAVGAVTGFMSALSALQGTLDVLNDSEASAGDKVAAVIGGITSLIPLVISLGPAFSTAKVGAKLFGMEATKAGTAANLAMWQVTLIVAGITALIAGITFLVTQESEAEKKAKKAAKAAEDMKESAEAAKTALNDLKSAFDSYDTAVDKLNECTKGTEEWHNAL
jgi:predicted  nucleic acid-binding Zn-ribbon protein